MGTKGLVVLGMLFCARSILAATPAVRPDRDAYHIESGSSFIVRLHFDADRDLPGHQPLEAGLLSMGVRIACDPALAEVRGLSDIRLPIELDGDGLGNSPYTSIDASGWAGAAGAVGLLQEYYTGSLLAEFTLSDRGVAAAYPLSISLYFDDRANFVDGNGNVLDEQISFIPATVITPEPSAASAALALGLIAAGRRRARCPGVAAR